MKKLLVALMISVFCIVGVYTGINTAHAKDVSVQVEFGFEPDFEVGVTEFVFYYQDKLDPMTLIEVTKHLDIGSRAFTTPIMDLPPGRITNFFISAVYDTGEVEMSEGFAWKFTGKPSIVKINK